MSTRCLILIVLCSAAVLLMGAIGPQPARAQGAFLAGAAKAKITPQSPQWIAGYGGNRRSIGAHDDLWARALVLKSGERWLAIASVDLLGLPYPYLARVRELVKTVPADALLVASTHTHSAPDVIGRWGPSPGQSGVDPAYLETVITTIAQVIEQAAAGITPAAIKYASGDLPGVSKNHRKMDILDPGIAALQAVGEDGKVIATLVNFACHPEIMQNNYITADFPNWLYRRVESSAGGVALFINGAQGGMITANIDDIYSKGQDNWDDAERIGSAIADKALEVLAAAPTVEAAPITLRFAPLLIPLSEKRIQASVAAGVSLALEDHKRRTEVAAGAIGRAEFATIPGEAFPNIGLLLKRWMTGDVKFIFGITQDELGYIMSREDWGLAVYKYETSIAASPEIGYLLVETLQPMIAAVNPQPAAAPVAGGALDAWFMGLPQHFNSQAAGDLKAVYVFNVTGDGGGDYTIRVADGKAAVERGSADKPDLKVTISAADMSAMLAKELDATTAFMTGKLMLDGDISLALKMGELFKF